MADGEVIVIEAVAQEDGYVLVKWDELIKLVPSNKLALMIYANERHFHPGEGPATKTGTLPICLSRLTTNERSIPEAEAKPNEK
jgi:hypothetical protein